MYLLRFLILCNIIGPLKVHGNVFVNNGNVIELDSDSFSRVSSSPGGALVKFYAPWCGYCRQFAATYEDAARALAGIEPNLIVARIDGTRHPVEMSSAGVKGYPTVLLFKGGKSYTFTGDRTVESVLVFVRSVLGPAVETLEKEKSLEEKIEQHFDEVFFLYCGSQKSQLWNVFNDTAGEFRLQLPFYRVVRSECDAEVFVYKDGSRRQFVPGAGDLQSQMSAFVEENRHPAFGQLSVYEIKQMASDSSFENTTICILLIDPFSESSRVIKDIGRELAIVDSKSTLKRFKFVWTVDYRGLSSLAMTSLEAPSILLYTPANESLILYPYDNRPEVTAAISKQNLISFLENAAIGRIPYYGGRGWLTTVRRFAFDFCIGSLNFFRTSPFLALLTFGIPLGSLSCLAYCICCSSFDAMDDSSFDHDVDAAAFEARRARLLDRSILEAKLSTATYQDAVRARSIYKRLAEKNRLLETDLVETQSASKESRKDL